MVENLRKMQELRAQIQAQLKLADTLKKLNENAGYENHKKYKQGRSTQNYYNFGETQGTQGSQTVWF